ncbi:MAG: N-acetylglutaminylglutamine amidotransferase, partial [Actinomycetota bacterium]|nr:N-acetylglutaminylglutamine amidotransferase [Actinomycetota bacterium]
MCGFAGELTLDGRAADVAAVARMNDLLRPRGPDGSGLWADDRAAVGHRRLSIIDLSDRAAQPMVDAELGLVLAFNGCIYNHRELRRELEGAGYRFFSSGDTEVVLKAYHHWGEHFVDHLVGMFACCVVERESGRAVLARDRLGIKPLYLAELDGRLRFASSLPSLLAGGGIDTDVDVAALHQHLTLHGIVPAPRSLLRGVSKLPPATVLVVDPDGGRRSRRYWEPAYERDGARSATEWEDAVAEALRTAVRRRLVADVPVGVLLSGGLDSSLIVALLAEAGQPGLQTFSIGFDHGGGEEGDEFRWSDLVAERYGTEHHRLRVPDGDVADALLGAVGAMSEPMASHDAVAFYLLSREVAEHVKVVQSGQGADEVFAGYWWHQPFAEVPRDRAAAVFNATFPDRQHADVLAALGPRFRAELRDDPSAAFVEEEVARPGAATSLDAIRRMDIERLMPDDPVKRVDNMTMAWSLEARVPFLDHELVELAATCPPELLLAE